MPITTTLTVGSGGTYADMAAARTALNSRNLIANDENVLLLVLNDLTIAASATRFSAANTDATHRIYVQPTPGQSYRDLNPSGVFGYPTTGIQLAAVGGSTAASLGIGQGWVFSDFRIACSTTGTGLPIFFSTTNSWSGFHKNWVSGDNTSVTLATFSGGSIGTPEIFDNVFIGTGAGSNQVVRLGGAILFDRNTVVATGASPALNINHGSSLSSRVLDCVFSGNVTVALTASNGQQANVEASAGNYVAGTVSITGSGLYQYTSGQFSSGHLAADLFEAPYTSLRPKAASVLLGAAGASAQNTTDINNNNRGLSPDAGAIQRNSAPPLANGTIVSAAVSGQVVSASGTQTNAVSGTFSLDGDPDFGSEAITIVGGDWTVEVDGVPAGTYVSRVTFLNAESAPTVVTGPSVVVDEYTGSPEGPEPEEPTDPPVVSGVTGAPVAATAATVTVDTTRSGGTLWVVITASATAPTTTQIRAGQNHLGAAAAWDDSQVPGTPGERTFNATGLTAEATYYAHAYHEHPDGDSNVGSSSAFTQPAVVIAPAITDQPDSITVEGGENAVFSVTATGTGPLAYQWRRDGANISGATSSSYTLVGATIDDSGAVFTCFVSGPGGSVLSNPATLTVDAPAVAPTITDDVDDASVVDGGNADFLVAATTGGGTLAYAWFTRPAGDSSAGTQVSGATASSYSTGALALGDSGRQYRARVTNEAGEAFSRWATVTVSAVLVPPTITTQPQSLARDIGEAAVFSVAASGTGPFEYEWYTGDQLIATTPTLTIDPVTYDDNGRQYHVVVRNEAGSATSNVAVLTLRAAPTTPGTRLAMSVGAHFDLLMRIAS